MIRHNTQSLKTPGLWRCLVATAIMALPAGAIEAQAADSARPAYVPKMRHVEDWSAFDPASGDDFFDPIKHIDLNDDGSWWLSLGGSARARFESWNNFGASAANDDEFANARIFLHADLHAGDNLRFFIEGKSSHVTGRDLPGGRRTSDVDTLDLHQAFADITFGSDEDARVTIRPGRQSLLFGKQRLVTPLMWSNTRRAWDGVSAKIELSQWEITPFYTQFVPVEKYKFNEPDSDIQFFGAYATGPLGESGLSADAYFLGLDRSSNAITFNATTGPEKRYTTGGRLFGDLNDNGLSFDIEAAYQFGEVGAGDISAYMFAIELEQAWRESAWSPSLKLCFDYASGDSSAGGDVGTFNPLFPLGHGYFGEGDIVGRQNLIAAWTSLEVKPVDKLKLRAQGFLFWRANNNDAVYSPSGAVLVPGAASASSYTGAEIDLKASYQIDLHTTIDVGYSHFFTGDAIDEGVGAADDVQLFYFQVSYTF